MPRDVELVGHRATQLAKARPPGQPSEIGDRVAAFLDGCDQTSETRAAATESAAWTVSPASDEAIENARRAEQLTVMARDVPRPERTTGPSGRPALIRRHGDR